MNDMTPAIEVRGVGMTFGDVTALDGLDLTVAAGTVFGLLGPNGAGKTTLVKVLSTLLTPTHGSAAVCGVDAVARPLAVRRLIGLAGQSAAVDGELTGRENLEMVGRLYRLSAAEARRRADEVLERFELSDAADRRVSTYSGGMRRRLDLGASLSGRPPVLLLDEPTTGLDPRSRQELWAIVEELRRAGTTVLLTTQYLDEADRLAQRIAVIDRGRVVAEGTTAELKATVGHEVLAIRMSEPQRAADAGTLLASLSSGDAPITDPASGEVRLPVAQSAAAAEAVRRLDHRGWEIAAIELQRPSLDDVFLSLTGHAAGEDHESATPEEIAA